MTQTTANILDGKALSERMRGGMSDEINALKATHGRAPGLAVIIVGNDPASHVYVRNKKMACEKVGIASFSDELPADTTQ
ncbi:MAG: tetrahydrofolate dehydrogenase/cyclohydrolase catalytic domain-containing protein, partial [Mariprofundaceae bacterium]